jgi:chromosome segregation ATPase
LSAANAPTVLGEHTEPIPAPEADAERAAAARTVPWGRIFFALLWMVLTVGVVGYLGVSWFGELGRRKDAQAEIASAQADARSARAELTELESEVAKLDEQLASARSSLATVRGRSARRGEALRYARGLPAQTRPLETSYAELSEALAALSDGRASLAAGVTALARDVSSLNEYVRKTNEAELSKTELRRLIRALQAEIAAVRSVQARLATGEDAYDEAAEDLETGFEDLDRWMAALRAQIKRALKP